MLTRILEPKRDEVTGKWRKLHSEELNDLYSSPNNILVMKSRRMRGAEHVARVGGDKRCTQGFGGETCEKRPLGRPRRRWEDNIKMELLNWGGLIWLGKETVGGHV